MFDYIPDDDGADEVAEETWRAKRRRAYLRELMAHPHPQDPDHPEPLESKDE